MKNIILILILMFISTIANADTKITAFTADTSPTADDLTLTVNDPGGTPVNRKVTIGNLMPLSGWTYSSNITRTTATIDSVGIGLTTPSGSLEIAQYASRFPLLISSAGNLNSGDLLTVDNGGRVSIGTTQSGVSSFIKLLVSGDSIAIPTLIRFHDDSIMNVANSDLDIIYDTSTSSTAPLWGLKTRAGSGGAWFGGTGTASTATIIATSSRNVGIGTWFPNANLEVTKIGTSKPFMVSSVVTTDGDYFVISSTGNVGIGSTTPNGAFIVRSSTTDIGWVTKDTVNQACNTTCNASCVEGYDLDTATFSGFIVGCVNPSADRCKCAGSD